MRRNSEGRVRVKGGFWEISCFPLISRSLGAAWAVVHVKTAMVMNERMIFLMIFFPYLPITLSPHSSKRLTGERDKSPSVSSPFTTSFSSARLLISGLSQELLQGHPSSLRHQRSLGISLFQPGEGRSPEDPPVSEEGSPFCAPHRKGQLFSSQLPWRPGLSHL